MEPRSDSTGAQAGKPCPVDDYLRSQGRFRHLFADERGAEIRTELQTWADDNARRLGIPAYGDAELVGAERGG